MTLTSFNFEFRYGLCKLVEGDEVRRCSEAEIAEHYARKEKEARKVARKRQRKEERQEERRVRGWATVQDFLRLHQFNEDVVN